MKNSQPDRADKKKNGSLVLFFLIVALVFTWPVFRDFDYWGIQDWDQHFFYHAVPRQTLLRHHQFPLWNPYTCGGTVLLANPQSRFLSPTFLLVLLLGAVRGIKIEIWLHSAIGLFGAYRLARYYRLGILPSLVSAFLFMGSSTYGLSLTVGMTWYMTVAYLPWVFLFFLRAFDESAKADFVVQPFRAAAGLKPCATNLFKFRYGCVKCGLMSAVFLVLIFFEGGAYLLAIVFLFLGLYSLFTVCLKKTPLLNMIKLLSIVFIFTLGLGAVKIIPSVDFLSSHPRRIDDQSGYSLDSLRFSLLSRDQSLSAIGKIPHWEESGFIRGVSFFMDENGMYLGIVPLLLILGGIGFRGRRQFPLALCLLVFLWISFGTRAPLSLWSLLHRLPVFDSMRVAQRFRIIVLLCCSLFAGFGLQALGDFFSRRIKNKMATVLPSVAVSALILFDLAAVNWRVYREAFPIPPLEIKRSEKFFQVWSMPAYDKFGPEEPGGPYASFGSLYPAVLSNIGIIDAYETSFVPKKAIPRDSPDYRGEVFFAETEGKATIVRWSPNRLALAVEAEGGGCLVVNQNYYPAWRVKGEGVSGIESYHGLLALKITPPSGKIDLYYLPTSFIIGLIVSAISLLAVIVFLLR